MSICAEFNYYTGDEYGETRDGNNNWYGIDSKQTWYDWKGLEEEREKLFRFMKNTISFRKSCPLLGRTDFLK